MTTQNHGANRDDLREDIKNYWSARAASFDLSPGHEIFSDAERAAWHGLIRRHLGPGDGRSALDLASGTGVIAHLMDDLGYRVTGLDWSEAMLAEARAKAKQRGRAIRFFLGDAEQTLEPTAAHDVIITRHLVWTLVDPVACFAEWWRVLKPGGRLLIIDGDFVTSTFAEQLVKGLARRLERLKLIRSPAAITPPPAASPALFTSILSRVHFSQGARAEAVADLLRTAGFDPVVIDHDLKAIHRAQRTALGFWAGVARGLQHRYAVVATKPLSPGSTADPDTAQP